MSKPSRNTIHTVALAGGAIAGKMPPLFDIPALMTAEVAMVRKLGKDFGVDVDEATATGILTACGCTVVGTAIFESVNIGYPFTIPAKIVVAVGVIEAAGNLVYDYFDKKYG